MSEVISGGRYRRTAYPRDLVWVVSTDGTSVEIRTASGLASMPVERFIGQFDYDPEMSRRSGGTGR